MAGREEPQVVPDADLGEKAAATVAEADGGLEQVELA